MENLTNTNEAPVDINKEQIRTLIGNIEDLQKMRIASGNRLVQSFYIQLGVKPSTSPDDVGEKEKKLIDTLKREYNRISDGVLENKCTIKKEISRIKKLDENSKEQQLTYIRSELDYKMMDSFMLLLRSEEQLVKVLDKYVQAHPLWDAFFKDIKGVGPKMAGYCIAYLDPYKARHVSSFYRYCGLDTVQDTDSDGNVIYLAKDDSGRTTGQKVRRKIRYTLVSTGEEYFGDVKRTGEKDENGIDIIKTHDGQVLDWDYMMVEGTSQPVYEDIETGEEYIGDAYASVHGRRMGDTEMFEYKDKNGETKMKRGLTYNPILKTKLMGVLTGCLLKAKDPVYSKIYYDYRERLDNDKYRKDFSDGKKNMMAQRYMVKQFLRNLWVTWRDLEGLEVDEPYEVAKLGNKPHKYNEYQYEVAQKYKKFKEMLAQGKI